MACTNEFMYRLTKKQRREIVDEIMKWFPKNGNMKELKALMKKYQEKMELLKSLGAEVKYVVIEKNTDYGFRTEVGVFDTKEEAEAAADNLADSYNGFLIDKKIEVLKVFKKDMKDKDYLRHHSILEKILTIHG